MTQITIQPSGAGATTECYPSTAPNWDCVNEIPAVDTDFVSEGPEGGDAAHDLYVTPASGVPTDSTINSVTVYFRIRRTGAGQVGVGASVAPQIRAIAQAITTGSYLTCTTSWVNESQTWATNPTTGIAWTVAEVNDLDIGVAISADSINWDGECSQVYAVITYTAGVATRTDRFFKMF